MIFSNSEPNSQELEKSLKTKHEKILNAEISNHKLTSNATLLTANMRKIKSAYNSLQSESQSTDPFQAEGRQQKPRFLLVSRNEKNRNEIFRSRNQKTSFYADPCFKYFVTNGLSHDHYFSNTNGHWYHDHCKCGN